MRFETARRSETVRSEPARVSLSRAAAGWTVHWRTIASANPASKHVREGFSLFATLRPSVVEDNARSARPESITRGDRRLANRVLPDRRLANRALSYRHLADLSLMIDGLPVRKVCSPSGSQHGKRCRGYDRNF